MRNVVMLTVGIILVASAQGARAQDGAVDSSFGPTGVLEPTAEESMIAGAMFRSGRFTVVGDVGRGAPSIATETVAAFDDHFEIEECDAIVPFMASFQGRALLADRADRPLVAGTITFLGSESQERPLVARYRADGSCLFDPGWSSNGWTVLDDRSFCDTEDCSMVALVETPTATPRVFGLLEASVNAFVSRYFVVAFTAAGEVDASFGSNGYAEVSDPGDLGTLAAGHGFLAVDGAGRPLVLAARYDTLPPLDLDPFVAEFTTDGVYDGGCCWIADDDPDSDGLPTALLVEPDGAIVVAAVDISANPPSSRLTRRRLRGGIVTSRFQAALQARALAWQGDHKLLVASDLSAGDGMLIQRFLWSEDDAPSLDPTFGNNGGLLLDFDYGGADGEDPVSLMLSAGRVVVAANADVGAASRGFAATRLLNAYLFADGFEQGNLVRWSLPH